MRRRWPRSYGRFSPRQVSALSAWLRLQSSGQTAGEWDNWTDVLNSNPAVQNDADRKPAVVASTNGLPQADFDGSDMFPWTLAASNNNLETTGCMVWLVPGSVTGQQEIRSVQASSGASTGVYQFMMTGTALQLGVYLPPAGGTGRLASVAGVFSIGVPACVGFEFNGGAPAEADECVLTVNGVAQSVTFSNWFGGGADMPDALRSATNMSIIGASQDSDAPTTSYTGRMGPNLFWFGSAMAGVASGLLTPQARLQLANFERPT